MLKDLMKSIFNEEVDLDEEYEEEQEIVEEPIEEPIEEPKAEEVIATPVTDVDEPVIEETSEVNKVEQEKILDEMVQPISDVQVAQPFEKKATTLGSLDVEKVSKKETRPSRRKQQAYHFDRTKVKSVRNTQRSAKLEYQNVMSPIFGNTANNKKDYKKVHNAVELEKPKGKVDGLDDVISPMFGKDIPKVVKEDKIPTKTPQYEAPKVIEPVSISVSEIIEKKSKEKPEQGQLFKTSK